MILYLALSYDIECGASGILSADILFIVVVSLFENISDLTYFVCRQILEYRHAAKKDLFGINTDCWYHYTT